MEKPNLKRIELFADANNNNELYAKSADNNVFVLTVGGNIVTLIDLEKILKEMK